MSMKVYMMIGIRDEDNDDEDDSIPERYRQVETKTGVFRVANREIAT